MVPYSARFMKRLGIQAEFDKSLKDICYIDSRPFTLEGHSNVKDDEKRADGQEDGRTRKGRRRMSWSTADLSLHERNEKQTAEAMGSLSVLLCSSISGLYLIFISLATVDITVKSIHGLWLLLQSLLTAK